MRYTVIVPDHNIHFRCWDELAEAVVWALQQLGHEAERRSAPLQGVRPIYIGWPQGPAGPDAIFYNTEQAGVGMWEQRRLFKLYRGHTVWDYSHHNASCYARWQLPEPSVVRPGYCPLLKRIERQEPEYDVAFFGSTNKRRTDALDKLEAAGLRLWRLPFGLYGKERDELLARAKLCINIHFYESIVFEAVRCSYLAINGIPVLSETSAGKDAEAYGMQGAPYRELPAHAELLCRSPQLLENLRAEQERAIEKISMVDEIGAALERSDHAPAIFAAVSPPPSPTAGRMKPELTLSMIVKDEASIIERCLNSVAPYLKRWCIVDTGSTDGTQDIIRRVMADLPGQLHERPWKQFDGSRTEALDLARKECGGDGWLLLIDADEIFTVDGELTLPIGFDVDCYNAWITRCLGCGRWARSTFARASKPWYYILPRHEGLYCKVHAPSANGAVENVLIISTHDGARGGRDAYERFMEDAQMLEKWLADNPEHQVRSRAQFYLAQSYRDAATGKQPFDQNAMRLALLHYQKRAAMRGGYSQETHAALLAAADCMQKLEFPWDQIQQRLLEAYAARPCRAEALFRIGERYQRLSQDALAELFLTFAARLMAPLDSFSDVDLPIYQWKAKDALATTLSRQNRWREARQLWREALRSAELLPHDRERIEENVQQSLQKAPE